MVREWIESHTVSIQVGDVFKHTNLPKYDPKNAMHVALSSLVERAHKEHDAVKRSKIVTKVEKMGETILISSWPVA